LRLENFFDALVISSDYGFRKPDPRLFHSEAAYIGNKYETDLAGAKEAGLAMTGLIRQSEDEKRTYSCDHKPDFVTDDLRAAFEEITNRSQVSATEG